MRGALRQVALLGLAGLFLGLSGGERWMGNRLFLFAVAGLFVALAGWGAVETRRECGRDSRRT